MGSHTLRGVQELLGLSRSAIVQLVKLGFVKPERGARRAYEFSFQDVVLLRTAHELRSASIPTGKILRALRRLKDELPADAPLSGPRITAVGNDIVVRNRDSQWAAELASFSWTSMWGSKPSAVRKLSYVRWTQLVRLFQSHTAGRMNFSRKPRR